MGFIYTIITIVITITIVVVMSIIIHNANKNRLRDKCFEIENKYPLAYRDYISSKFISISQSSNSVLREIVNQSTDFWNDKERKLQAQERKRIETEIQYRKIKATYPIGLNKWETLYPNASKSITVSNEERIKNFENAIKTAKEYNVWEKEQQEYTDKCYQKFKNTLHNFGWYHYNIPFTKTDEDGNELDGTYKVWQFFAGSYCKENDLDYSDFEEIKQNNTNDIDQFKKCDMCYKSAIYDKIKDFVCQLNKEYQLSVYLCTNNSDWNAKSLYCHYKELFNIQSIDEVINNISEDSLDYNYYPKFKNRHIVIIDIQTENKQLFEVCKKIIKKNKYKHPLITYISLFKGFDREEMLELINKEKQKRIEEENRKRKEKENRIISICQQYGITGLYHMTHIDNLASILSKGLLSHNQARNNNYLRTDIANNDVNVRRSHNEPIHNRPIHDYAPLYFNPKNPMLYFRREIQNNIVILEFSPLVFLKEGVIFTDGNASVHTTATYNSQTQFYSDLNDLNKLDWKCINDKWWNDYEDGKRKKCAEVLIPDKIELSFLKSIHVFSTETQNVVSHFQIKDIDIEVTKSLFFE